MENPWPQLPIDAPRVLPSDRSIIDAFNARYAKTKFAISLSRSSAIQTHAFTSST